MGATLSSLGRVGMLMCAATRHLTFARGPFLSLILFS